MGFGFCENIFKNMKLQSKIFIAMMTLMLPVGAFASTENPPTGMEYKNYKFYEQSAKTACDTPNAPWGKNNSLLPIPQYPELSSSAVNAQIERLQNQESLSDEEKRRLQNEATLQRIGNFSGFKTLEVARLQYRSTMNGIFACGIISSRLSILDDFREAMSASSSTRKSEIQNQLDKEQKRLENERDKLKCNSAGASKTDFMAEMVNSSTRQYCHYRHYLTYLETNLESDLQAIEKMEKEIGQGNGTQVSITSEEFVESYNRYTNALSREITRADTTLPRAIRAYKEMEKVYPTHLMLTIIYDDFIRLRANLAKYMNASTQTYLKAYNAQDANNR